MSTHSTGSAYPTDGYQPKHREITPVTPEEMGRDFTSRAECECQRLGVRFTEWCPHHGPDTYADIFARHNPDSSVNQEDE